MDKDKEKVLRKAPKKTLGDALQNPNHPLYKAFSLITEGLSENIKKIQSLPSNGIKLPSYPVVVDWRGDLKKRLTKFEDFIFDYNDELTTLQRFHPEYTEAYHIRKNRTVFQSILDNPQCAFIEEEVFYSNVYKFLNYLDQRERSINSNGKKEITLQEMFINPSLLLEVDARLKVHGFLSDKGEFLKPVFIRDGRVKIQALIAGLRERLIKLELLHKQYNSEIAKSGKAFCDHYKVKVKSKEYSAFKSGANNVETNSMYFSFLDYLII